KPHSRPPIQNTPTNNAESPYQLTVNRRDRHGSDSTEHRLGSYLQTQDERTIQRSSDSITACRSKWSLKPPIMAPIGNTAGSRTHEQVDFTPSNIHRKKLD